MLLICIAVNVRVAVKVAVKVTVPLRFYAVLNVARNSTALRDINFFSNFQACRKHNIFQNSMNI